MKALSKEVLWGLLVNPKNAPKGNICSTCPFCNKEKHFFIHEGYNRKNILHAFMCQKCKESGDYVKFLNHIGKEYLIEGEKITNLNVGILSLDKPNQNNNNYIEPKIAKLPVGSKLINFDDESIYRDYLIKRKMNKIDFDKIQPLYNELLSKFDNYVTLPIYKDFTIRGYVSRYILNKEDELYDDNRLRYINSSSNFSSLLFGYDDLTHKTEELVLNEGV